MLRYRLKLLAGRVERKGTLSNYWTDGSNEVLDEQIFPTSPGQSYDWQ
jgi:hypothetical protein